jgi:hypothetical protein
MGGKGNYPLFNLTHLLKCCNISEASNYGTYILLHCFNVQNKVTRNFLAHETNHVLLDAKYKGKELKL